jgi:hypothetical protein
LVNTLLRSLIVWLLLLAVPYQGMAAAAMLACAPAPAKLAQQAEKAQHPPCHEAAAPDADTDQKPPAPHGKPGKCASCAACPIGTAVLPARLLALAAHAPATATAPAAAGYLPSVHLDQPERPPRHRLA